jgi:hypothetical protein
VTVAVPARFPDDRARAVVAPRSKKRIIPD